MTEGMEIESAATPEVQAKAEKLGWIPPTRFKGDSERFIDADEYLERGETVLPIVREHNKRLQAELESVRAESVKTAAALKAAQTAIEQIEERHSVATQKAVEQARKQLKQQLAAASEAGDFEGVAELTDQLVQMNAAEAKAEKDAGKEGKDSKDTAQAFVPDPELVAWNKENPWYGTNKRKTALALGIAQELREGGEKSVGREFYEKVGAEVELTLKGSKEETDESERVNRVEGARNGRNEEMRSGAKGKGYAALPPDAKKACDDDARNFVGPSKKYKSLPEWRNRYAELYFEGA